MKIKLSLTALLLLLTTLSYSQGVVFSSGDFDFEVYGIDSISVRLTALDGTLKGDVVIPDSVTYKGKTYAVTQIENMGDNPSVQSIWIPKTVSSINSLSSLSALKDINVDESNPYYKSIDGLLILTNNMSLTQFPRGRTGECVIPEGVERIAISLHSGITKLTIPSSVNSVPYNIGYFITEFEVAKGNKFFKSINGALYSKDGKTLIACPVTNESIISVPSSVDSIGSDAFQRSIKLVLNSTTPPTIGFSSSYYGYNTNITGIYVKSNDLTNYQSNSQISNYNIFGYDVVKDSILYAITNDGNAEVVGSYCQSTSIVIPQTITDETDNAYSVTKIGRVAFYNNNVIKIVKLPETLKSIGDSAFYDTNIQEITLPASLTEIGKNAFYYCYDLDNVYAECAPLDISAGCFYYYRTLYVPGEYEDQYKAATGWKNFSTIISKDFIYGDLILKKLTDKTVSVVKYMGSETNLILPDEVTINNKTYKITAIGESAFEWLGLTSVKFPKWLEEIGSRAFYQNNSLKAIELPTSLKTIGGYAFYDCSLTSLNIPSSIENIGDNAFGYNYDIEVVIINSQVPFSLGSNPFYNGIKMIVMPSSSVNSFKAAEQWQNYNIYGIDAIIDDFAYQKLNSKEVLLSCCLKSFNEDNYNKLTIPDKINIDNVTYNVTVIGEEAFYSAYYLNELSIPESIDSIGSRAFNYNTILRMESLNPPKTNDQTFYDYPEKVIVLYDALEKYKSAENWKYLSDIIMAYDVLIDNIVYVKIDESHVAVSGVLSNPEGYIFEIPEKVKIDDKDYIVSIIGSRAFSNISGEILTLPQTLDSIGSYAGYENFNLVYLKSTTPPRLGSYNYHNIYVPTSALNTYLENVQWVSYEYYKRYIHGTDGIVEIDSVIYNINKTAKTAELCIWMKANSDSIVVPKAVLLNGKSYSVTSLREQSFSNFNNTEYFRIPETVNNIGAYALPTTSNMIVISEAVYPPTIGSQYSSTIQRQTLYVNSSAYDSYKNAEVWKDFGNIAPIDAGDDQFYYAKAGNGKAIVTGLKTTTSTEFEIPETVIIDGKELKVSQIGKNLFLNNRTIQKIILPNTIEEIGDQAFFGSSLQQIAIPTSVNRIGERAFSTNSNIYTYSSLTKIQVRAGNEYFMQRNENLLLSKDGKKLLQSAQYCGDVSYSYVYDEFGIYSRKEINPLDGIEQIALGALDGCRTSSIKLPASLSDVDASVLMYMPYLRTIDVDTLHQKLCSIDGILFSKDTTSIVYYPYYKSQYSDYRNYELPIKVQNIEKFAFYNFRFETLTLSDSLKTIADSAFYSRNNSSSYQINSLILMNEKIATASQTAFNNRIFQNTILYVPMGTQNDYLTTSPWSNFRNINSSKLAEEDFLLLKAFYEEMGNGEGWYRQWNFGPTADETRITRGIRMIDDHIYSIDLSNNGLKGGLSDKLFKLPRLEILYLNNNQLSCPIDSVLNSENVDNEVLREFYISGNQLTGNLGAITNTLKNLTTLDVSYNKLTQVTPMLSSKINRLSLSYQQMNDTIDYKSIYQATKEDVEEGLPNLLFYDHENRNYTSYRNFYLRNTDDSYWIMSLNNNNGNISASEYSSSYRLYNRPNGDILQLGGYNGHSILVRMLYDPGDVNFDTLVNVSDLQLTVNYAVSEKAEQLFNFTAADIQKDDWVNVQDVVSLVNILLDQHIDINSAIGARVRSTKTEDADAQLFWRGNQLIMRTDYDITALDIAIENAKDVKWLLDDVDYDFSISKQKDYIRVIHYSMAGKDIKAGETVVAEVSGDNMGILKADLVCKDGHLVKTISGGSSTGIKELSNENSNISLSAYTAGVNIITNQSMGNLQWAIYNIGGKLLGKGISNLSSGSNTLYCNLVGENQVVVRLSNDKINITKKVSVSK